MTSCSTPPSKSTSWTCPFRCGQQYRRSSGRSIRRHVMTCFRANNRETTAGLTDVEVFDVICDLHESGRLATGLRSWKQRRPQRSAQELSDGDRWDCVWGCGKSYRSTSSRSILRHANRCMFRTDGQDVEMDIQQVRTMTKQPTTGSSNHDDQSSVSESSSSCSSLPSSPTSLTYQLLDTEQPVNDYACALPSPLPQYVASDTPRSMSSCTFTDLSSTSESSGRASSGNTSYSSSAPTSPCNDALPSPVLADIQQNFIQLDTLFTWIRHLSAYSLPVSPPIAQEPLPLDQYIAALTYFLQSPTLTTQ